MKRILIAQPSLQPPGGGNVVAAWILEALKRDHRVSVLTWTEVDVDAINRYAGTELRPTEIARLRVAPSARRCLDAMPLPLALLKSCVLLRAAKRAAAEYDLVMTVNNEADLGGRGIQYVHFPWAYQPRPVSDRRWYHGSRRVVALYHRLCMRVADFRLERMRRNLTLANSAWTASKLKEVHGIDARVLHPPLPGRFPDVPWNGRQVGFACVGRISPEKELDKVIDVVSAVRRSGHDVSLCIIGTADDARYAEHVRGRVAHCSDWARIVEDLPRDELAAVLAGYRYGIHGMSEEHFGMAIGEMMLAGCVVFAPAGGGPREILEDDERLLYRDVDDATAKIVRVLEDRSLQEELHAASRRRAERLSADRFVDAIRTIVSDFR